MVKSKAGKVDFFTKTRIWGNKVKKKSNPWESWDISLHRYKGLKISQIGGKSLLAS